MIINKFKRGFTQGTGKPEKKRPGGMNVYTNLWMRWVFHKQPFDMLALSSPQHGGSTQEVARQVYHRLVCRLACAELWSRLIGWSGLALLLSIGGGYLSLSGSGAIMSTSIWPFLLFLVAFGVLCWLIPSKLMNDLVDEHDIAEAQGVIRRVFLRDIPADTPADLADVWRYGWTTSEGRPIAGEITEADARATTAREFAFATAFVIFFLASAIGSLAGSVILAGFGPLVVVFFLFMVKNPLIERGRELEVQEAVEGIAYSEAGGEPWAMGIENARTQQLAAAKRDKSPLVCLGTSTGLLAARGDNFAPSPGLPFSASLNDLQLHLIAFGGTGSGKTTGVLVPIARAVAEWDNCGLLVLDGKGALPKELEDMELKGFEVVDPHTEIISLVSGLDPLTIVDTLATILGGSGSKESGTFWIDSTSGLLRRAAVIAHALGGKYWCLTEIAAIAFQDEMRKAALEAVRDLPEDKRINPVLREAMVYLHHEWPLMDEKTASGIIATGRAWISTITAHGDLLRWAKHTGTDSVDLLKPLNGGRLGLLLPAYRYGKAGAVVTALLKARFFAKIKARAENPNWKATESPIMMLMDEAQEIATEEDATMLAIGRSLGLSVIAATQTVEGVIQRLGDKTAHKWLTIFGNALTLAGRSPDTDFFMARRAGSSWRLAINQLQGMSVRTAIDANMVTGVMAAGRNQSSIEHATAIPGTELAKLAWFRITKPIAQTISMITNPGNAEKTMGANQPQTTLGPRPIVDKDELQSLLAEPDTAFIMLSRGRVMRRDIVRLNPYRPARPEDKKPEAA